MNPRLAALVPAEATGPMECQELMALDFRAHYFPAFAHLPSYTEWLLDADLTSTYRYERRVLKLLQWGEPEVEGARRPWRLKCPSHLLWLDDLAEVFPDARFVMTHRDPTDVMVSVADLYCEVGRQFSDGIDPHYLGRLNVEQWTTGMDRVLAFREVARRRPVLRHRLPGHAARPRGRGPRPLRLARRAGHRRLRGRHGAVVARQQRRPRRERPPGRRPSSGSTSTRSAPGSPTTRPAPQQWTERQR